MAFWQKWAKKWQKQWHFFFDQGQVNSRASWGVGLQTSTCQPASPFDWTSCVWLQPTSQGVIGMGRFLLQLLPQKSSSKPLPEMDHWWWIGTGVAFSWLYERGSLRRTRSAKVFQLGYGTGSDSGIFPMPLQPSILVSNLCTVPICLWVHSAHLLLWFTHFDEGIMDVFVFSGAAPWTGVPKNRAINSINGYGLTLIYPPNVTNASFARAFGAMPFSDEVCRLCFDNAGSPARNDSCLNYTIWTKSQETKWLENAQFSPSFLPVIPLYFPVISSCHPPHTFSTPLWMSILGSFSYTHNHKKDT